MEVLQLDRFKYAQNQIKVTSTDTNELIETLTNSLYCANSDLDSALHADLIAENKLAVVMPGNSLYIHDCESNSKEFICQLPATPQLVKGWKSRRYILVAIDNTINIYGFDGSLVKTLQGCKHKIVDIALFDKYGLVVATTNQGVNRWKVA